MEEIKEKKKQQKTSRKHLTQKDVKKYSKTELNHIILKIKANERRYTIITTLIFLTIILITFAIIVTGINRTIYNDNIEKTKNLIIEYKEQKNGIGNIVDLVNVKKYTNPKDVKQTYSIKIKNTSKKERNFQIKLVNDEEMIKYDKCEKIFLNRDYLKYSIDNENIFTANSDLLIAKTLKPQEEITYNLKIWVDSKYEETPHYHGIIKVEEVER